MLEFPFAPAGRRRAYQGKAGILAYMKHATGRIAADSVEHMQVFPMQDPDIGVVELTIKGRALASGAPYNQELRHLLRNPGRQAAAPSRILEPAGHDRRHGRPRGMGRGLRLSGRGGVSGLVLVTGGTGKTGRRVAEQLSAAGSAVRVASRGGSIRFDWSDPDTWAATLDGVSAVYLVPPPGAGDVSAAMIALVQTAMARGARRFVLLSGSPMPEGGPGVGQTHRWLRENTADWAVLRPSWFMQNFSEGQHLATIRDEGAIYSATEDGRVPFISADDIAACAVAALTGPEPISYDTVARQIGEAVGRPIAHRRVSAEDLAAWYRATGRPAALAQVLGIMDTMIAGGAEDRTTDCVQALSGRAPTRFEDFASASRDFWATLPVTGTR
ncbi:MAG: NAD(P)H-binding protein [Caulobacteraceae bacterium]